ncbi:proteasome complex subunit Rpn13 ubiquitin receptor-domain-containing protein [Baffinella frigidus]|nr:proteasome complex subunit Rpn13 ubiquitin receptor-domain-containing protein [Cryptophyta sp. CCMP2293]
MATMQPLEVRAGKMKFSDGMLRPDDRRGLLRLFVSPDDQLTHLTWTSRVNNVTEDDRILFPGDAEFSYIEAARANISNKRVYALKFTGSTERLYFWMQEPDGTKDTAFTESANAKIAPEAPAAMDTSDSAVAGVDVAQMDQSQLLSMLTNAGGAAPATPEKEATKIIENGKK